MNRAAKRLLLSLAAGAAAFAFAELAVRRLRPEPLGMVILAPNGERVPGGEIAHFLAHMADFERNVNQDIAPPHGHLLAHAHVRFQYPNARWPYFDENRCVRLDINSLGFRDDEFVVDKQPGELRVLALGDSFTQGQGVQLADSWPQVLERELARLHAGPVQVINGGFATGHHSPDGYDAWMASDGLLLHPDLVIVGLCLNDLCNDVPMLSYPVAHPRQVLGSVLLGEIARMFEQRRLMAAHRAHPPDYAQLVRDQPQQWQGVQRGLRELQAMLQREHVPLVVAIFPMLSEYDADPYPYEGLHTLAREFCKTAGIRCVDLRQVFHGRVEEDLWVDLTDQHPNDVGHRLMAFAIRDYLLAEGLAQPR
jgi:lysophospholipase L1-like esterase